MFEINNDIVMFQVFLPRCLSFPHIQGKFHLGIHQDFSVV